jgi:hypothetical protein
MHGPGEEALIIRDGCGDRRLLQHDLGDPDAVRVAALARPSAPRQVAPVPVIPGEQPPAEVLHSRQRRKASRTNRLCRTA